MAKWGKRLLGLAAIGSAVAGLVYYLKNKDSSDTEDEFCDDLDDEDYDLDNDLKSVADREYVPLNSAQKSEESTVTTDTPVTDTPVTDTAKEPSEAAEADTSESDDASSPQIGS